MSRQYFADTIVEPLGVAHPTITATTITPLVPVAYCPIPAFDMRPGKVYELLVGGTCTTGASGTLTLTALLNAVSLGAGPAQTTAVSVTAAPFFFRGHLIIRGATGLAGATCPVVFNGTWISGGVVATAASQTTAVIQTSAVNVDPTIAQTLSMNVTFSVAPSVIPFWHCWRSLN
jgi:hypothetical protein